MFPSNVVLIAIPGLEHLRSAPAIACYFSVMFCFVSVVATMLLILNIGSPEKKIEHVEEGVSFRVIVSHTKIMFDYNLDRISQRAFVTMDGSARVVRANQLYSAGIRFIRVRVTI